jgi:hypothetical protein
MAGNFCAQASARLWSAGQFDGIAFGDRRLSKDSFALRE